MALFGRGHRAAVRQRRQGCIQQASRMASRICVKVFPGAFIIWVGFQVQRVVCVVMVVVILYMHRQMRHLTGALRHRHRAEHPRRLPQKDNQQEKCAQANRHGRDFSHATAKRTGVLLGGDHRLPATAPTAQALWDMARFFQDNSARTPT